MRLASVNELPTPREERLMTLAELAEEMRIGVSTLHNLRKQGREMGFPMPQVQWSPKLVRVRPSEAMRWASELQRRRAA